MTQLSIESYAIQKPGVRNEYFLKYSAVVYFHVLSEVRKSFKVGKIKIFFKENLEYFSIFLTNFPCTSQTPFIADQHKPLRPIEFCA